MNFADQFYDKIKKQFFVPTLFFLTIQCSVIFFVYEYYINLPGNATIAFILLGLSIYLLPIIYENSISKNPHSNKNYLPIKKISIFILVSIIIASIPLFQIIKTNHQVLIEKSTKGQHAIINKINRKRYYTEAILNIHNKEKRNIKAIAYIHDDIKVKKKDEIIIHDNPIAIKYDKNNNYNNLLLARGFKYKFYLKSGNYHISKRSAPSKLSGIRCCILEKLKFFFNPETSKLVQALVTGNKNCISKKIIHHFKKAGVLHVLAASGLHVGIIAFIPFILLGPMRINKKAILLITLNIIYFYIMLTTMPVSLLRSIIMFSIFALLHMLHKQKNIFNALFLSAIIILIIFPFEIKSPAFHLSFGATLGILLFFNIYKKSLQPITRLLTNSISLSLSALVIVYPIIYFHMKEINLIAVLSNIFIVPLVGTILVISIITIIISFIFPLAATYLGQGANYIYNLTTWIVKIFSSFDGHFYVEKLNFIIISCYVIFLIPIIPFRKIASIDKLLSRQNVSITIKTLNKSKNINVFLFSFIPIITCWIILNSDGIEKNKLYIINNKKNKVILLKNHNKAEIIGELANYDQCRKVINLIKKSSIDLVQLHIIKPDYSNIKYFTNIARSVNLDKCFISTKWMPAKYMENLFKVLSQDNIDLKFINYHTKKGQVSGNAGKIMEIYNTLR